MSIYATFFSLDDEHEEGCASWRESTDVPGVFEQSGETCSCGLPMQPLAYRGSHIVPDPDDRGGALFLCAIPDHIERDGRKGPWDYVRISVFGVAPETGTVILTRPQVEALRDTLTAWLEAKERA